MKIFKRALACLLALGCLLSLGACGQSEIQGNVLTDDGWEYFNGKGSFSLAVQEGMQGADAPRLLRPQPQGEWMLMTSLQYSSASADAENHAGAVLYSDEDNYLIWGPKNGAEVVLSGKLKGKDTQDLISMPEGNYLLRIWKVTRDAQAPRYYFYCATDSYYGWQYGGMYEDVDGIFENALYGVMGESAKGAGHYCAQFEYIDEFTVYNYKDYFRSEKLDGRWINTQGSATSKSNRLYMSGDSFLLRNPMPYDWTIETQVAEASAEAGLLVQSGDNTLRFCLDGQNLQVIALTQGKEQVAAQEPVGEAEFLRIIKRGDSYICKTSTDGKAFREVATVTDGALKDAQYGLYAKGDAQLRYFWEGPTPEGKIQGVSWFEEKGAITGEDSLNQTQSKWGQGSTDLGSMFQLNGAVYMVFGDTFQYKNQGGTWYKNSIAKITDLENFQNGPVFDWVKINANNGGLVNVRPNTDTGSMIATAGAGVNRDGKPTLFIHTMEIRRWTSYGTHWVVNGSGWASSTDDGNTWKLHERVFEGDTNFAQLACHQPGDGYVYMLGAGAAGYGQVKLCRAPEESLEKKEGYEFFTGTDAQGNPEWSPREEDAVVVIDSVNKEIGVVYNPGLDRFLFTTLDNVTQQMVIREAENIWGPWSKPTVLLDESYVTHEDIGQKFFYGSFMCSQFMEDDGKTVYMTLNKWVPYNIQWLKVHFETKE